MHGGLQPVTLTRDGLDEDRVFGRVPQGLANLFDRGVQPLLKLAELGVGPESLLQLFASDDFAGTSEEEGEQAERLFLQPNFDAALGQFSARGVGLKNAEPSWRGRTHIEGRRN